MSDLDAIRRRQAAMPNRDRGVLLARVAELEAAPIDVERLAQAIKVEGESGRWSDDTSHEMRFINETLAALIAETYAALARPESET